MLELDPTTSVSVPVDAQGKCLLDSGKDSWRYTPSKRMFLGVDFQNDPGKKKNALCSKSNSRNLKKKRHKDKFKLLVLDKHLWDPTVQFPQLGRSSKNFKKKNQLSARAHASGQISGNEVTGSIKKGAPIDFSPHLKPLEFTFDILQATGNAPPPTRAKESEESKSGNDLFASSSTFPQEVIPNPNGTNKSFLKDLIVFETPKPFNSKVSQHDDQLSKSSTINVDELANVTAQLPILNPLINSAGLSGSEIDNDTQVGTLSSGLGDHASAIIPNPHSLFLSEERRFIVDAQCNDNPSQLSNDLSNLYGQCDQRSSPQALIFFPGQNSPWVGVDKPLLVSQKPRQTLVDQLNKDPYPRSIRKNTKVQVRRRAFSLDDTQIVELFKPLLIRDPKGQSEVGKEDHIVTVQEPGFGNSGSEDQIQKLNPPTGHSQNDHSMSANDSDTTEGTKNVSLCDEISGNYIHESPCGLTKSKVGDDCSITSSQSADDQSICGEASYSASSVQATGTYVIEEDSVGRISDNSEGLPEECKNVPCNLGAEYMDQGLNLSSGSNIISTQNETAIPPSKTSTCTEQGSGVSEETSSAKLSISNAEDICNDSDPVFHQQLSSELDTVSANIVQETVGIQTLGIGLLVTGKVGDGNHVDTPPENIVLQNVTDHPESIASRSSLTNLSEADSDGNKDCCQCNNTTFSLATGLSVPEELTHVNAIQNSGTLDSGLVDIPAPSICQSSGEDGSEDQAAMTDFAETAIDGLTRYVDSEDDSNCGDQCCMTPLKHWVLPPGKKFRRSLSIIRNLDQCLSPRRGRHFEISVEEIIKLQGNDRGACKHVKSLHDRLSLRRPSVMTHITPRSVRRDTLVWSPRPVDRGTLYETPPRESIYSTPLQKTLRMTLRASSPTLGPRRSLLPQFNQNCSPTSPVQYTIRDLILTICKQTEPISFLDILNEESYKGGCKLGEGVFGEVFSINRDGQYAVLKIIPIEGERMVNGEKQKTYQEVLSELVIAKVLDELRYESSDELNLTTGYAELVATSLVQGSYPKTLLRFWEEFDQLSGSDNDNPQIFDDEQLFIVMEQGNGGKDLESYTFSSAKQSLSIFKQVAFSLAVAETSVEFEHRDLHWGNVLVSKTSEKHIFYTLNGTHYSVATNGVKCTIIDYTLSRIKYINQFPIFNDIGKDPEMFIATGDYQFDIYRLMKDDVANDWSRFIPKTNARWLDYLLDKMLSKVKYQRRTAKVHKDSFKVLEDIGSWIEGSESAATIALRLAESKN